MRYPGTVTRSFIRQGGSYAMGTIIDGHLAEGDNKALYELWKESWPEPLELPGSEKAITCEMVLEVPESEFKRTLGRQRAGRILKIAREHASSY